MATLVMLLKQYDTNFYNLKLVVLFKYLKIKHLHCKSKNKVIL